MCRASKKYFSVSEGYFKKSVVAITFKAILGLYSLLSCFESLLEIQISFCFV
jgi:hypothetical protein